MKKLLTAMLMLVALGASSQIKEPESYTFYQIINTDGFSIGHYDESNMPKLCAQNPDDTNQIFEFIPSDDGTYMIRSASDYSYVCMITSTWDTWSMSFDPFIPADISKAEYTIESIAGTDYVGLKNMGRLAYCGWDTAAEGQGIYCNKPLNEKSYWKISQLPLDKQVSIAVSMMLKYADEELVDYAGLGNKLYDLSMVYEGLVPNDATEAREAVKAIQDGIMEVREAMANVELLKRRFEKAEKLLSMDELYPGADDLSDAFYNIKNSLDPDSWEASDYENALRTIDKAINDYYYSQVPTIENPADYTFLVKSPHFCTEEAEPSIVDGVFVYPNGADYVDGQQPLDASDAGWYKGAESGGAQRVSYLENRICWMAFNVNFNEISINQDLSGLPSGYYSISADMSTHTGCVTDQHLFVKSSTGEAVSPALDPMLYQEPQQPEWTTLTTDKLVVSDGKLTIGAKGSGDSEKIPADCGGTLTDYRRGWFMITNFRLFYHGPISEDEIKKAFAERLENLQAMCDTVAFKGDKKTFQDTIDKYKDVSSVEDINTAMEALSVAEAYAAASNLKYHQVINEGIVPALADSIENESYTGDVLKMAQNFYECMMAEINAADASYLKMDSLESILYAFRDKYISSYNKAVLFNVEDAEAKSVLENNISRQVEHFVTFDLLPEETLVYKYISELEDAVRICLSTDLYKSGTNDYTSLIVNPGIDSESTKNMPDGWFVSYQGTQFDDYVAKGQQVDGDRNGYFFSAWNSSPGHILYHAYQTISHLPNGIYEMKAMVRTTCDQGAYLYAIADNDSNTTVLKQLVMERLNITELGGPKASNGEDSIAVVSLTYGSIFADLYKRTNGGVDATEEQGDTLNANGGNGYGWFYEKLEIEVKNHILTIGFTCDSTFTKKYGGKPFGGISLSADNFTLKLLEEGDNSNWNPVANVELPDMTNDDLFVQVINRKVIAPEGSRIYTLSGYEINIDTTLEPGIYIVCNNRKAVKVVVR